eukprot:4086838-Pleurochrysis_carterae.AAC.1
MYCAESSVVTAAFFHHFASCLRRPAGRADRAGSQQAAFTMDLPSIDPLRDVLAKCQYHKMAKYTIANGEIVWARSRQIDSYYLDDELAVADFLALHLRENRSGAIPRPVLIRMFCLHD